MCIRDSYRDSPADIAGMRRGDIVTRVDEKPVKTLRELQGILSEHEPGNEVKLDFRREGESRSCKVKLARLADVMPEQK